MLSFIYLQIDVIFLKFQLRPHHYERPPVDHSSPSVSRGTRTAVGLRSHQIQSSVGIRVSTDLLFIFKYMQYNQIFFTEIFYSLGSKFFEQSKHFTVT